MGRCGVLLAEDANDFGEFLHEVAFRVQAASRVAEKELDITAAGAAPGIVTEGCGVTLILATHDLDAELGTPSAELFDGCRAEGVCRHKEA